MALYEIETNGPVKIGDVVSGGSIRNRATVVQQKTGRPVQFELMTDCRKSLLACAFGWASRRREVYNWARSCH